MLQFFVLVGLAVGVLAIATWLGTVQLKVAHPPTGDFLEVEGPRVHIAVLGLPPGATGADPPVVLIHGASGIWRISVLHSAKGSLLHTA